MANKLLTSGDAADFTKRGKSSLAADIQTVSTSLTAETNKANFKTGEKEVATSGTGVQLPAQAVPDGYYLLVVAKKSNTGAIFIGETKAISQTNRTSDIGRLDAGDFREFKLTNADKIWIDADNNNDGVDIFVESD